MPTMRTLARSLCLAVALPLGLGLVSQQSSAAAPGAPGKLPGHKRPKIPKTPTSGGIQRELLPGTKHKPYWRFSFTEGNRRMTTRGERWSGVVAFADPRRDGRLGPVAMHLPGADWVDFYYVGSGGKRLSRPIMDGRRLIGRVTFDARGASIAFDLDRDANAEILYTAHFKRGRLEANLLATDSGLGWLEARLRNGEGLACLAKVGDPGVPGSSFDGRGMLTGVNPSVQASLSALGRCSGGSSSRGGGLGGTKPKSPLGSSRSNPLDRFCTAELSQSSGGRVGGTVGKDPRRFHWGDAFRALLEDLSPMPTSDRDIVTAAGEAAAGRAAGSTPAGAAFQVVKSIRAFLEGGRGEFVNEADRSLYHYEQNAASRGVTPQPDPEVLQEACAAGSSSDLCGGAAEDPSAEARREGGTEPSPPGGNSGGGSIQPIGDEKDMAAWCRARAEAKWRMRSYTHDTRYVKQECKDPRVNPKGQRMRGASGVSLRTYCGSSRNSVKDPADVAREIFGRATKQCGKTAQPGVDGTCSRGGVTTGQRTPDGPRFLETLGATLIVRPCPDQTCNPPR